MLIRFKSRRRVYRLILIYSSIGLKSILGMISRSMLLIPLSTKKCNCRLPRNHQLYQSFQLFKSLISNLKSYSGVDRADRVFYNAVLGGAALAATAQKSCSGSAPRLETKIPQGVTTVLGIRGSKLGQLRSGDRLLHSALQVM